jgi:hypothetical protein
MPKRHRTWVYSPPKPKKPSVPHGVKAELTSKAQQLIDEHLRPAHVKPAPKMPEFNYIKDIFTMWYQSYFYFCATYASPHPDAFSPTFESRFARMGYQGEGRFNLAYMRHTGQWWDIHFDLSIDESLKAIKEEPHFLP